VELRRLLALAKPERTLLAIASLALLADGALTLVAPQGLRILLDEVTRGHDRRVLDRTVVALLALFAVSAVFTFSRAYLFTLAGERFVARLRRQLFSHIVGQEIGFFDTQRTGELINRISADTQVVQNSVTVNVSMALRNLLQTLGSIAILMWTSPRLTLFMLAIVPVVALGAMFFARTVRRLSKKTQDALAAANAVAEETMSNIRTVRSFARETLERSRYDERISESFDLGRRLARTYGLFQGAIGFAGSLAIAVVLWYGGTLVLAGAMSVGVLTSFMLYTLYLAFALASLTQLYGDFNRAIGASGRVFELLDRQAEIESDAGQMLGEVRGEMRFADVGFAYPARPDSRVLSGVDLVLEPGRVLALVGRSGSGKSTIAALMARFYDPSSGDITFDGHALRTLSPTWLRAQIGTVAQEPVLFAASIADNIRYGRLTASTSEIEAAARAANAHEFISEFSEGYDTLVGERGVRLSGGQKQRVAIARALLKDPRVLILDEATSALDGESEHLVHEALERLMQGRTVLVIAHRLSTVRGADEVVVLQNGRIVERGRHDELAQKNGPYRRLVEHQFGGET
jgi:ATP-binding cassette subfamily B protein